MPKRSTDPTVAARTARDAVEKLNHATAETGIPAPVISATTQTVLNLLQHLPQALEQLTWEIAARQRANEIRMDDGTDPADAVREVDEAMRATVRALQVAATRLQRAATPLFHMATR
ncbi:hypothetical protein [Kitasatospora sp. NPDC058478]|uniref:hypothetical protein n=1 Tax=unclassified Kitasatospora TaxID=2633591 RepID=UPI0036684ABE